MNAPSSDARRLTAAFGAVSAAVGALVFVAPKRAAEEFAWNVSAFVAMTIGAWCLGNAWVVLVAVRNWRWAMNLSLLVYLWAFSLLEVLVLVWFRDKLRTDVLLAWPYLLMLGLGLLAALVPITAAALVYIGRFDFSAHPGQTAYIGAYVLVAVAVVAVLYSARIPNRP